MKTQPFDADYYGVAFATIARLALRYQNEDGSDGDDLLDAIEKIAESMSRELFGMAASSGDKSEVAS